MLVNPDKPCLCESGRTAAACCFPAEPPILQSDPRIVGADIEAELVAPGIGRVPWPKDSKPVISLNQPGQLDEDIESVAMGLIRVGAPRGVHDPHELVEALRPLATRVRYFSEALYAARYHQLQFLFRLRKVVAQQTFAFSPPRGNTVVRINDRPMRAELEAFLVRVTSALDATAKVLCTLGKWGDKHESFGLLLKYLKNTSAERSGAEARLLKILRQHEGWVAEMKELRHAIAHEGTSEQFVPVSHEGPLVQDAKVAGFRAGEFVVRTWMQIKALTSEVPTAFQP